MPGIPGIMTEEFNLPAIADGLSNTLGKNLENYSVKYFKADMDDVSDVLELQNIETRALRGTDIVLLKSDKYTFLERYFIIIQYLEKNQ